MTILQEIIEFKKEEILKQKKFNCVQDFENIIKELPVAKNFYELLKDYKQNGKPAIIAEVKKASPSKGVIREDFNHVEIAEIYEKMGAVAISVLTDEKYFQGKIEYLSDIRKISDRPLLRKDFIIDEFQIYQTRSIGADIILLIVAALDKKQLEDYFCLSKEVGLEVLLEAHDEKELDEALEVGAEIIGINNRDLKTFNVNLQTTVNLMKFGNIEDKLIISESGIKNNSDVKFLMEQGVAGILAGEVLLKQKNIETIFSNLVKI